MKIKKNMYSLRVYCTKCKRQYNYHNIENCDHAEYQHYKSLVSDINGRRRTKMYRTKNFDEALISAIQFRKDVKNGVLENYSKVEVYDPNNLSIIDAANLFLNFCHGNNVPSHKKKNISKNHLSDIERNVKQLINIFRENNVNVEMTTINSLNDYHVGYWYDHVTSNYSVGSYPTKLKIIKSFINHMIDEVGVTMGNPFKSVKFDAIVYDTSSITKKEFLAVLDAVDNKSPYKQLQGKRRERKNHYRPYLIDGFKLALYTGLRREELVTLSWNDLYFSEKTDGLIFLTDNLKVERITGKKYKKKYIPVGPDLYSLLVELGYEDFKDSTLNVLHPHRVSGIKTIIANLSKGFTHFYKQAFPSKKRKTFKILRKTYLSYLNKAVGDDSIELSSHGSKKILSTHYIDAEVVAKGLTMKIFK
ncbi:site-specific integrase [Lutimonas vermicola]|uniref:Site-specific integrase n=1 Tax=Lutimonas vermicola TaxID=414288 RepID=A0ABU9L3C7_9FLAO